jgi:uracil-DNA glycosylase family 4
MEKQRRYLTLAAARRECRLCEPLGLTNPSVPVGGRYDAAGHIGAWTRWQGNLDAEVMVIGQDWGGIEYFIDRQGLEQDNNPTNKMLCALLSSVGIRIELPRQSQHHTLFFTNSILCLRPGRLTGPVKARWFKNCSETFLRQQIELVDPRVIVTPGYMAYQSVLRAYDIPRRRRMRDAVKDTVYLPKGNCLVPVYHPGKNGTRSRSIDDQKMDWQRVKVALNPRRTVPSTENRAF